jgi:hypothetical protein
MVGKLILQNPYTFSPFQRALKARHLSPTGRIGLGRLQALAGPSQLVSVSALQQKHRPAWMDTGCFSFFRAARGKAFHKKLALQAANGYLSTGFFFRVITDLRTFQTLILRGFNCTLLLSRRKRHGFLRSSERRIQNRREHLLNMRPCRQIATDNGLRVLNPITPSI